MTVTDYVKTDTSLADVLKSVVDKWNSRAADNVQNKGKGGITEDNGRQKNVFKTHSE